MPITNWYLIFTRPNCEKKVVDTLIKRGIENYCPYNKVVNVLGNRRKLIYKPLFTSFVFVRLNPIQLDDIKKIDGVTNLVYWLDKPAVIRDIEIEMMRRFLNEHANVQLEKTYVNVNEMVRIANEDRREKDGNNLGFSSKCIKLVLPTLGYSLVAEVDIANVEIIVQADPVRFNSSTIQNN